ncbi:MAG: divalent-cation tolerance protein CutA [Chthoniobacterales bacterium]|jgi:periplasmic divalent cation tolerance protein
MTPGIRLLLTTFADEAAAATVVRSLLDEHLIACGSLIPGARSIYRWKGAIEESSEVQVILKTSSEEASRCMVRLAELHPYEVPEIIELEPASVSAPYAAWVRQSVGKYKEG